MTQPLARNLGALREEVVQLPGSHAIGLRAFVVPTAPAPPNNT